MLSAFCSLVLHPCCGINENLDGKHFMNGSSFGDINDILNRDVMRIENKETVWREEDAADEQQFFGYKQNFLDTSPTSLKSAALVANSMLVVLVSLTYSFRRISIGSGLTFLRYWNGKGTVAKKAAETVEPEVDHDI